MKWLEIFSQLCMQRYLECDDMICSEKKKKEKTDEENSILNQYHQYLIGEFQSCFSIHFFHAILFELEQLNQFKVKQITKHLQENNTLIQNLFNDLSLTNNDNVHLPDDGIIHISSTPAQPIYLPYKPIHMVYLRTKVFVNRTHESQWPCEGVTNTFVADLIHTKRISILNPLTNQSYDIPTKWIYFAQSCESNSLLILKLRVFIVKHHRYGIIGEEPGKNNQYRCLVFYIDEEKKSFRELLFIIRSSSLS